MKIKLEYDTLTIQSKIFPIVSEKIQSVRDTFVEQCAEYAMKHSKVAVANIVQGEQK